MAYRTRCISHHTSSMGWAMAFRSTRTRTGQSFASFQTTERSISIGRSADSTSYEHWRAMAEVGRVTLRALQEAQRSGASYLLLLHGCSMTDGEMQTTARSVIRGLMRSKAATPYIVRNQCIQHHSCFVAAIRPLKSATPPPPIDLRNARLYRRRQTSPQPLREAPRR